MLICYFGGVFDLANYGQSYGWMVRATVENFNIDENAVTWTEDTADEPTYQITSLNPATNYVVQVRGDYGTDGLSKWATTTFTTEELSLELADNATDNGEAIKLLLRNCFLLSSCLCVFVFSKRCLAI